MKLLRCITASFMLASAAAMYCGCAEAAVSSNDFIEKVSEANLFEVQSGQLALNKSRNQGVRQFAQRMVTDHTAAAAKLKTTLSTSGGDTDRIASQLSPAHRQLMSALSMLGGRAFDKQYVSAQKDTHTQAVSLFTDYAAHGNDAALNIYATQSLPMLKMHLEQATKLSTSVR